MSRLTWLLVVFIPVVGFGQFSPDGGLSGSIALHADSVAWVAWASRSSLEMGYYNVADSSLGRVPFPAENFVLGEVDGNVVSLGDGGSATVEFGSDIFDGPGPDFAVFENGFAVSDTAGFFELATVSVSSDGAYFVQFPCTSLTDRPVGSFGTLDSRKLDGLAGRFSAPYGAPFDLSDLPDDARLDKQAIRYVRIVDVVGTPESAFAKTDQDGMIILDPYPTAFNGGGFDLDAVGAINARTSSTRDQEARKGNKARNILLASTEELVSRYPNSSMRWFSLTGNSLGDDLNSLLPGSIYVIEIQTGLSLERQLLLLKP